MGQGHGHGVSGAGKNKRQLAIVFFMTSFYLVVEVIGGFWTGSLALLADAGHMLTDVAGVGLALLAIKFAERPASPERTYGYYRVEILAALTNAVVLILISLKPTSGLRIRPKWRAAGCLGWRRSDWLSTSWAS